MPEDRKRKAGKKAARKRVQPVPPRATSGTAGRVGRWRDAASELARAIRQGQLAEGERLPKESQLAQRFGLSRHSLRRALAELARQGLIEIMPRIGARVAPQRVPYMLDDRSRFIDNIQRAGRQPGGRLLSSSQGIAPPEIAGLLEVARRTPVIELHALRSANDLPLMVVRAWLPADRFPRISELFAATGSFTKAFAQLGLNEYKRRSTSVSARPATAEERRHLRLEPGATVLTALGLDVDAAGEPISATQAVFAADRVELVVRS